VQGATAAWWAEPHPQLPVLDPLHQPPTHSEIGYYYCDQMFGPGEVFFPSRTKAKRELNPGGRAHLTQLQSVCKNRDQRVTETLKPSHRNDLMLTRSFKVPRDSQPSAPHRGRLFPLGWRAFKVSLKLCRRTISKRHSSQFWGAEGCPRPDEEPVAR
jgi:hypothetical protein